MSGLFILNCYKKQRSVRKYTARKHGNHDGIFWIPHCPDRSMLKFQQYPEYYLAHNYRLNDQSKDY